ncbi:MAG TPA: murein biosynthesis integral membrane protein MurJ, partial [Candidatus Aerophobetes bacterium]|nr:murein biosynthesis integral membrane protein MurJ [Candidatus Aerophobetes bacterium]
QFLFQVPPMIKRGFVYRPILFFKDPGVKKIARLMGPTILGGITLQANVIITRIFASTLAAGSISSLQYAMRLIQLPLGLFAIALSTAIFPSLSFLASEEKLEELRETTSLGIRTVFLVLIPSSVGLIIIREPLIRLLFEHGAFLQRDTLMTSQALFYYSFGLAAMGEVMILTRAFYSLQDVLTPLKVSLFILALNVLLNFLLIRPLKHSGLALATSISMLVNMLILFFLLKRKLREMEGARIINSLFKVSLISAAMGTGVRYLLRTISSPESSSLATQAFQVSLAVIAGLVIFCSLAYLIKLEEFKLVLQALKEKGRT